MLFNGVICRSVIIRGVAEMQKGAGEMASSSMSESSFLFHRCVQFLWPFSATEAEGAGAQCQMLSSVTSPGVQVKVRDGE